MRQILRLSIALVLCSLFSYSSHAAMQAANAQSPVVFPHVSSYNLNKARINFPADFAGQLNLLLISFADEQQRSVATWLPAAQSIQHTNFNFHYYRLPVSSRENFMFRWWENSSMRSDQTDPETWPWTVPLYLNKNAFVHDLGIPNQKQVVTLLVDKSGRVLWRAYGPLTPEKKAALLDAVAGASGHTAR